MTTVDGNKSVSVEGTADRAVASQCQSEVAESHTPAPWPEPDTGLYAWGGKQDSVLKGGVLSMADYLRARACVNACEGLDPAKLRADHEYLKAQNAELLAALQLADSELRLFMDADAVCDHSVNICACTYNQMREAMRAAIAKAGAA